MDFKNFTIGTSTNEKLRKSTTCLVDEEVMQSLIDEGLTTSQIANRLNLTPRQVTTYKNHRGMKQCRTAKLSLTDIEEQVIIGSILGDGCIDINNRERDYYRLTIKHGEAQREYIWYKYQLLKRISKAPKENYKIDKREKFKNHTAITLCTTTNEVFKEYRKNWYPNDKKEVYEPDLMRLSNLGLAIWIMDDGYTDGSGLILSTDSFNNKSIELIVSYFNKNSIRVTVQKGNRVRIAKESMYIIRECVIPYIHPTLIYKVRDKERELLENPEMDNQQPRLDRNISKVQRLDRVTFRPIGTGEIPTSAFLPYDIW